MNAYLLIYGILCLIWLVFSTNKMNKVPLGRSHLATCPELTNFDELSRHESFYRGRVQHFFGIVSQVRYAQKLETVCYLGRC